MKIKNLYLILVCLFTSPYLWSQNGALNDAYILHTESESAQSVGLSITNLNGVELEAFDIWLYANPNVIEFTGVQWHEDVPFDVSNYTLMDNVHNDTLKITSYAFNNTFNGDGGSILNILYNVIGDEGSLTSIDFVRFEIGSDYLDNTISSEVRIIPEENCVIDDACNYNEFSLDESTCAQHEDCNYFCDIGLTYYQDSDGDGLGNEEIFQEFCLDDVPEEGWVLGPEDGGNEFDEDEGECPESNPADCFGVCGGSAEIDGCGVCNGDSDGDGVSDYLDACGVCFGNESTCTGCMNEDACNYDASATIEGDCETPEENYDCDGVCINDTDDDGICDENEVYGCTDAEACNYDLSATEDNDSCEYAEENFDCDGNCIANTDCFGECGGDAVLDDCNVGGGNNEYIDECGICFGNNVSCTGCMDEDACNFDDSATINDGCAYAETNYDCDGVCINDTDDDGICDENEVYGCTDAEACNYDATATEDNDSCEYAEENHDCEGNCIVDIDECGVCGGDGSDCVDQIPGCTDEDACNYLSDCIEDVDCPNFDNGSCEYPEPNASCDGECLEGFEEDNCGVCGGNNSLCMPVVIMELQQISMDTIAVNINNPFAPILGFQFNISGFSFENAFGGISENIGFDVSVGPNGALGFSLEGLTIPANSNDVLTYISGELESESICLDDVVVSIDAEGFLSLDVDSCINETGFVAAIPGCMEELACNYNSEATEDDESCEYAEENYDCNGNCITSFDCFGECGGSAVLDDCNVCGGNNIPDECGVCFGNNTSCTGCMDEDACNFDDSATINDGCAYAETNYDCDGNCINDEDEDEICNENEIYGCSDIEACNFNSEATENDGSCEYAEENYDCIGNCITNIDCFGVCGGEAYIDDCNVCGGMNQNCEQFDCNGDEGGSAFLDDCGVCSAGNTGHVANSDIGCDGECFGPSITACGDCASNSVCDLSIEVASVSNDFRKSNIQVPINLENYEDYSDASVDGGFEGVDITITFNDNILSFDSDGSELLLNENYEMEMNESESGFINGIVWGTDSLLTSYSGEMLYLNFDIKGDELVALHGQQTEIIINSISINTVDVLSSSNNGILSFETKGCIDPMADNFICPINSSEDCPYMDNYQINDDYFIENHGCEFIPEETIEVGSDGVIEEEMEIVIQMDDGSTINITLPEGTSVVFPDGYDGDMSLSMIINDSFDLNTLPGSGVPDDATIIGDIVGLYPLGVTFDPPISVEIDFGLSRALEYYLFHVSDPSSEDSASKKWSSVGTCSINESRCTAPSVETSGLFAILYGDDLSNDVYISPTEFKLHESYPNPFNPVTNISFDIPIATHINISIFNINGQIIHQFPTGYYTPGHYGFEWDAGEIPTGIYLIQMKTDDEIHQQKVMLLK